jgi:S1-C subfamily serine protease
MRFMIGFILALALVGDCAADSLDFDVPPPAVVPALEAGAQVAPVSFARMAANLAEGQGFADVRSGYVACKSSGDILRWKSERNRFTDPDFERMFRAELAKAGLNVSGDQTNLFEEDTKAADLQIGALVTDIKARLCLATIATKVDGAAIMRIDWQLYSVSAGKVVARIPTLGGVSSIKAKTPADTLVKLVQEAFAENVRQLEASPQFRQIILSPKLTRTLAPPSSDPLKVAFPAAAKPISIKEAATGAVVVFAGAGSGSGVLISADGYILTNHHVAGDSGRVRIRWADGTESVGEVVRTDRRRDIALIKVATAKGRPLAIRSTPVELGETVYAIGTPLDSSLQNTVTKGIVSATRMMEGQSFIQSDTPVTHGNSGGPLLDERGAVVGLSDLGADPSLGSTINFFIPIGDALKVLALKPAA